MQWMDKRISVRLREDYTEAIEDCIKDKKDKYDNPSHFIRCAVIQKLREEGYVVKGQVAIIK